MHLLTIIVVPLLGLAGVVLLFGVLSPVPILRPALAGLFGGAAKGLRQSFGALDVPNLLGGARTDARIAALESRNRSLETRVAELTECVLRSLAISMETQERIEMADEGRVRSRRA